MNRNISWRHATPQDSPILAEWNHQLIRDEGHRNPMTVSELAARIKGWLEHEYQAVVFSISDVEIGYALYRHDPESIYLRQFFIRADQRRRGHGRECFGILREKIWPKNLRLTVDVLCQNVAATAFWRAVGYADYSLTLEILPDDQTTHAHPAMRQSPQLGFREIDSTREADAVAVFLSRHTWPFHARASLTLEEACKIKLGPSAEVRAFWIHENDLPVGVVRAFDLEDADVGSVAFDLRVADECRGRGIGRAAIGWLVEMLFAEYPLLHRIEASTRFDNHVMRRALEFNKFVLEGRLRQTWRSEDGTRHDTALYGRLRGGA